MALMRPALADDATERLAGWMSGNFSSERQSHQLNNYFNLRLHLAPIWPERSDGPWLYSEHASVKRPERPFRQRVIRLEPTPDGVRLHLYELPSPRRHIGAWLQKDPLNSLTPQQLLPRPGCNLELVFDDASQGYIGRSDQGTCANRMYGASYALTELEVYADRIVRWTKGYDDQGQQIWGAAQGGYRFERL